MRPHNLPLNDQFTGPPAASLSPKRPPRRRDVNRFVQRIDQHPGRIFRFNEPEADTRCVRELISRAKRAICEIGSGSGGHLIQYARTNVTTACFGFELRFKRAVRTIEKSGAQGIENTYVLHLDARHLEAVFPPESLDAVYVFFPDPWLKERHRKHRLLNEAMLSSIARVLKPGGELGIKTDNASYFTSVRSLLAADSGNSSSFPGGFRSLFKILEETGDLYESPFLERNIPTEFERLFRDQKQPIYWLRAIRSGVRSGAGHRIFTPIVRRYPPGRSSG